MKRPELMSTNYAKLILAGLQRLPHVYEGTAKGRHRKPKGRK